MLVRRLLGLGFARNLRLQASVGLLGLGYG